MMAYTGTVRESVNISLGSLVRHYIGRQTTIMEVTSLLMLQLDYRELHIWAVNGDTIDNSSFKPAE